MRKSFVNRLKNYPIIAKKYDINLKTRLNTFDGK